MQVKFSLQDKLGSKLAPAIRRVADRKIEASGTKGSVLRIITNAPPKDTQTDWYDGNKKADILGNSVSSIQAEVIDNVIINYPFSNIEIFERYNAGQYDSNPVRALDLFEFLPITMKVKFYGDFAQNAIQLQKGDLIVDVVKNDTGQFIPVILEVMRERADLRWHQIVGRGYELALHRGVLEKEIQDAVDLYLSDYETAWNEMLKPSTCV
jgi:hypothetical protein